VLFAMLRPIRHHGDADVQWVPKFLIISNLKRVRIFLKSMVPTGSRFLSVTYFLCLGHGTTLVNSRENIWISEILNFLPISEENHTRKSDFSRNNKYASVVNLKL